MKFRSHSSEEDAVRSLIENWAAAVRRKDLTAVLEHHSDDFLMFDLPPPLQCAGLAEYEKTWALFYSASPEPVAFDIRDIAITAGADVAFAAALMRCRVKETDGSVSELDFRLTIGLEKINGAWTIVHEHHSIPAAQ